MARQTSWLRVILTMVVPGGVFLAFVLFAMLSVPIFVARQILSGGDLAPSQLIGGAIWTLGDVALVVLFTRSLRVDREAHRDARGQCVACGYDLRATPGRCPECGAPGGRT